MNCGQDGPSHTCKESDMVGYQQGTSPLGSSEVCSRPHISCAACLTRVPFLGLTLGRVLLLWVNKMVSCPRVFLKAGMF